MHESHVPLTMGSPRSRTIDVGLFKITEAEFPPDTDLPPHLHDRVTFGTILEGGFDLGFARRTYECTPGTVFTEPLGDRHSNRFGPEGVRILVIQPDHERSDLFYPCRSILERIIHHQSPSIKQMAWRLSYELRTADEVSRLSMQGVGLEMLGAAARLADPRRSSKRTCPWLARAEEMIRARFLDELSVQDIAAAVDLHPIYVARAFRAHYRESIGSFIRRLRVHRAADDLASSDTAIADVALAAGFADQSHLTRTFRRYMGITPAAFRKAVRS